jgi:hypothetical protein
MPNYKVLVVAVENASRWIPGVTAGQLDTLRPLIKSMKVALDALASANGYAWTLDYLGAPIAELGADLRNHLPSNNPSPVPGSALVAVASEASRAAKTVVTDRYDPANRIPIVFTVVSYPKDEGLEDVPRISGVSRDLGNTAADCLRQCTRYCTVHVTRTLRVHWIHRKGLLQANWAHDNIMKSLPPTVIHNPKSDRHQINSAGFPDYLAEVENLPQNPSGRLERALFLIPDDLVGASAREIITAAQNDPKRIPVFVQQPELVDADPQYTGRSGALAGYGVTPEWVGVRTAKQVDQVLRNPDAAVTPRIEFPLTSDFVFRINPQVAQDLLPPLGPPGGPPPDGVGAAKAGARKAPAKAKPARKAQATKGKAKTAKKGATRARRSARRRPGK